jgi:hypothetical protein
MAAGPREIGRQDLSGAAQFRRDVVEACQPVVIRGLVSGWPVVGAGLASPAALQGYLAQFDAGLKTEVFAGEPDIAGKYFYNAGLDGFNFERRSMSFGAALETIVSSLGVAGSATLYMGSQPVAQYLPGFSARNSLDLLDAAVGARIWLGHASNVSSHYDTLDNLACVVAGRRRFTLYPPDAIGGLYAGPIDNTMAGQPVSLAASSPQDEHAYPRFSTVKGRALTAELEAGDALYLPKLWWHQVESLAPLNVLVNYWWDAFAAGPDAPYTSLLLSLIAIAERPPEERKAWKAFFDHYVFRTQGHPLAHLPPAQHGLLGPLKPDNYRKIRAHIMRVLRGI